jgi:hypothetical protein
LPRGDGGVVVVEVNGFVLYFRHLVAEPVLGLFGFVLSGDLLALEAVLLEVAKCFGMSAFGVAALDFVQEVAGSSEDIEDVVVGILAVLGSEDLVLGLG